jgi:hypothetical protein
VIARGTKYGREEGPVIVQQTASSTDEGLDKKYGAGGDQADVNDAEKPELLMR